MKVESFLADNGNLLVVHACAPGAQGEIVYAFYLYQGNIRIAVRGYESRSAAVFRLPFTGGDFRAVAFAKDLANGAVKRVEAAVVTKETPVSVAALEQKRRLAFTSLYQSSVDNLSVDGLIERVKLGKMFRADVEVGNCVFPAFVKPSCEKKFL